VQGNDCNGYIWNETPLHIERQDVADSFGDDRYKLSGFDFNIPNQDIPFREVTITVCVDSTLTGAGYSLGTKQFTIDKLRQHDVGGYIFSVFIALLVVFCLVHILTMRYLARIRYTRKTIFLLILSIILSIYPYLSY